MPNDLTGFYNCPDCKSQQMSVTSKDLGFWSFRIDNRGVRVPAKFITTGKTWSRVCPKCGFKGSKDMYYDMKF